MGMILNLTNLLVGFSLIIVAFTVILNYFTSNKINLFFVFITLSVGVARFRFGLVSLGLVEEANSSLFIIFIIMFLSPPILYYCLKSFISIKITWKEVLLHTSIFLCILAMRLIFGVIQLERLGVLFIIYGSFYYVLLVNSSRNFLRSHQTIFNKQQLFKVKQITIWVLALALNNTFFTAYYIFFQSHNKHEAITNMYHGSIILWCLFLIYLFFNPSILFNEIFTKKDPNRDFLKEFSIWNRKELKKLEPQDVALEIIVRGNMEKLIEDLKNLKPELIIHSNGTKLIHEISNHLNYPKSHLKFALKYHCRFSQSDYLNLIRVIHALNLINDGYLEKYTIETLGEVCHFNSRTSFYRHFKKHMGVSPSRYKRILE